MTTGWESKIKEAAVISFEKNISTLELSFEEHKITVDLDELRTVELKKKVLTLPHQVMVLLFSRHCFGLSFEETELFYDMKNAEGRYLFYLRLLSNCMGLPEQHIISETSLSTACDLALKEYNKIERAEHLHRERRKTGRSNHSVFRIIRRRAAALILIGLLSFSSLMVMNADFREGVKRWFIEIFDDHSIIMLINNETVESRFALDGYQPTYLPEGAELINKFEQKEVILYEYNVDESKYLNISIVRANNREYVDTENAEIKPFETGGISGFYFKKDTLNYLWFEKDGLSISVFGTINIDELKNIAAGIRRK